MKSAIIACLVLVSAMAVYGEDGFVSVYNSGGYVARFFVEYEKDGVTVEEDSGTFTLGVKKTIKIPEGAKNVYLKTNNYWIFGSQSNIFSETFPASPVKKCYKVWGTTFNPKYSVDKC